MFDTNNCTEGGLKKTQQFEIVWSTALFLSRYQYTIKPALKYQGDILILQFNRNHSAEINGLMLVNISD